MAFAGPGLRPVGVWAHRWRHLFGSAALAIALLISVEYIAGRVVANSDRYDNLALPPHQTIMYELRDAAWSVSTNRLGFRGPEFPIRRREGAIRILVLGNSFAYGWALNFESTWPYLLERELNAGGIPVEVANLATPGTTSKQMAAIAARAIPLLKPDLVIVAVLQGASLVTFNAEEQTGERERPPGARDMLLKLAKRVLPNFVLMVETAKHDLVSSQYIPASTTRRIWREEAETLIRNMSESQAARYQALDPATTDRLLKGELNTALIRASLGSPDLFTSAVDSADVTGGGVMGMADMFRELKRTADDNHSAALVVSMPCAAYLGGHAAEILRRVGFNIPDALNGNRSSDEIVGRAAAMGDLPFISLLDDFQDANVDGFFLPFDGHYTSDGARFFAGALKSRLYPILAQMRKTLHVSGVKIENR